MKPCSCVGSTSAASKGKSALVIRKGEPKAGERGLEPAAAENFLETGTALVRARKKEMGTSTENERIAVRGTMGVVFGHSATYVGKDKSR